MNCAEQAAKTGVRRFIDVSTAQVYSSDKVNDGCSTHGEPSSSIFYSLQGISSERSKLDPWTLIAKHKLAAENAMAAIEGYVGVWCGQVGVPVNV